MPPTSEKSGWPPGQEEPESVPGWLNPYTGGVEGFRRRAAEAYGGASLGTVLDALACADGGNGDALPQYLHAAEVVMEHGADFLVVAGILLCHAYRDGTMDLRSIEERFGADVARVVRGAGDDGTIRTDTENNRRRDLESLLDSMAADVRGTIARIGLRLADLEGNHLDAAGYRAMARETLDIHAPMTSRLGMKGMRQRLEDVCFRILEPRTYREIESAVAPERVSDAACMDIIRKAIEEMLGRNGIEAEVTGRVKGLYSIYRKMCALDCSAPEIMDKIGLRIIVRSVPGCYAVLGILHTHFRPIPGTFDDYIGLPKDNGYQSLHTCVYPLRSVSIKPVEFQIRTRAMHREAELGIAAHWRYKSESETRDIVSRHLSGLRSIRDVHTGSSSYGDFVEKLRRHVFDDCLVVFTGSGRQVRLPAGATVMDFLIRAGSGAPPASAAVNGVARALDHPLRDGDTVEIDGQES
jgi:GTP pyrophosphokinase